MGPMLYSLASFVPDPDALLAARLQGQRPLTVQEIEQFLQISSGRVVPPDLLAQLPRDHADRGWLRQVVASVEQLVASGRRMQLVRCDHLPGEDGETAVTFQDASVCAAVREGDRVLAGVAVARTAATGLVVLPRYVRKVCANGAVVATGGGIGRAVEPHEVGDAIQACLEPAGFEAAIARFRGAAEVHVDDVGELVRAAGTVSSVRELQAAVARDRDRSLWGLVNAATSLAHGDARWSRRLRREADAGRLLAVVGALV